MVESSGYDGCLKDTTVLCAASSSHEETELVECVESLGGKALRLQDATAYDIADILVSAGVMTEAYKFVQTSSAWMPKLSPSWLTACQAAKHKVDPKQHLLKPFSGITVSISGGASKEKVKLQELIKKNGGLYSPELTRACTHLAIMRVKDVNNRTVSAKETHGRMWGTVQVVWDSWLIDNVEAGHYTASEARFAVPVKASKPSQRASQGLPQNVRKSENPAVSNLASAVQKTASTSSRQDKGEASCASLPSVGPWLEPNSTNRANGSTAAMPGGNGPSQNASSRFAPKADPAQDPGREPKQAAAKVAKSAPTTSVAARQHEPEIRQPPLDESTSEDEDTMFLSGALVHLTCCTPQEQYEMICILREGGCTRRSELRPDATHVVVGSDVTVPELQALSEHVKKVGSKPHVAKLNWLRVCKAQKALATVTEEDTVNPHSLLASIRIRKPIQPIAEPSNGPQIQGQNENNSRHTESGSRCFEGCFFSLAALKGSGNDESQARMLVRQGGGRCFDHRTVGLIVAKEKAFAVCPPSLPPKLKQSLCRENPDFDLVLERNLVTLRWLDVCFDADKLLLPISSEHVECQPLPFALPLSGMDAIRVVASNMAEEEKLRVKLLVKLLGGMYTLKMSHKNTHLVVPYSTGEKFLNANKYGVKPVTCRWLLDVARSGRLLPEKDYLPTPPIGQELGDQSQFPFEAAQDATQGNSDAPKQGVPKQSLFSQVMGGSTSRSSQGGAKPDARPSRFAQPALNPPRASQAQTAKGSNAKAPSKLDTLFSSLKTPVKSGPKSKATPLKDKVWQSKKSAKQTPAARNATSAHSQQDNALSPDRSENLPADVDTERARSTSPGNRPALQEIFAHNPEV